MSWNTTDIPVELRDVGDVVAPEEHLGADYARGRIRGGGARWGAVPRIGKKKWVSLFGIFESPLESVWFKSTILLKICLSLTTLICKSTLVNWHTVPTNNANLTRPLQSGCLFPSRDPLRPPGAPHGAARAASRGRCWRSWNCDCWVWFLGQLLASYSIDDVIIYEGEYFVGSRWKSCALIFLFLFCWGTRNQRSTRGDDLSKGRHRNNI